MFSAIRRRLRLTPSTAIATLALVFAMSGGAYAAGKYVITSTKQISPKVLKSLKGANGRDGAAGPVGPAGPTGPAGAAGTAGTQGPAGANGTDGQSVTSATASSKECPAGGVKYTSASGANAVCNGKNGTTGFTETLPSGKTETGVWGTVIGPEPNAIVQGSGVVAMSFNIPLAAALPEANIQINPASFPTGATAGEIENCPGNAAEPKAKAGFLCLYTTQDETEAEFRLVRVSTAGGVVVDFAKSPKPGYLAFGSWAVTA